MSKEDQKKTQAVDLKLEELGKVSGGWDVTTSEKADMLIAAWDKYRVRLHSKIQATSDPSVRQQLQETYDRANSASEMFQLAKYLTKWTDDDDTERAAFWASFDYDYYYNWFTSPV